MQIEANTADLHDRQTRDLEHQADDGRVGSAYGESGEGSVRWPPVLIAVILLIGPASGFSR
jgi:hypothetical protein